MSELGQSLRELRLKQGLSLRALAGEVGVSFPHLSKIEAGSERPSNELLTRLAETLQADKTRLFQLAERLPDEVAAFVTQKDLAPLFLRRWQEGRITDEQVSDLLRPFED